MKIYNKITDLIGNTPLVELKRFGEDLDAKIIAKMQQKVLTFIRIRCSIANTKNKYIKPCILWTAEVRK